MNKTYCPPPHAMPHVMYIISRRDNVVTTVGEGIAKMNDDIKNWLFTIL
jgi:hypothetical protein